MLGQSKRAVMAGSAFWLAFAWSVWVMGCYFLVDGRFMDTLRTRTSPALAVALCAGAALVGLLAGWGSGWHRPHQGLLAALLPAGVAGVAVWAHPALRAHALALAEAPDRQRVTALVLLAVAGGLGFGTGCRLAGRGPSLGVLSAVLLAPVVMVTLLGRGLGVAVALAWFLLLARALGERILSRGTDALGWVVGTAVGLTLLSLMAFVLGVAGLSRPPVMLAGLLALSVLERDRLRRWLKAGLDRDWSARVAISPVAGAMAFAGAILFAVFWVGVLAPETGHDALGGRLAMPALFLRAGSLAPIPEILWSYGLLGGETLFLWLMPVVSSAVAKALTFGLSVLTLFFLTETPSVSERLGRALWLLPFWAGTLTWAQLVMGHVDVLQLFLYVASVAALARWIEHPDDHRLLLAAAVAAAGATTVKLNGASAVVLVAIVAVVVSARSAGLRQGLRSGVLAGLASTAVIGPWMLRAFVLTGNPLFPFFNRLFGSPLAGDNPPRAPFGPGLKLPDVLLVPWGVFFEPGRFVELGTFHPFILAMLPLGVVGWLWGRQRAGMWFAAGGVASVAWLVTEQNSRYWLFGVLLLAVGTAVGVHRLCADETRPWRRRLVAGWAVAVFAVGFAIQTMRPTFWLGNHPSGPAFPTEVVRGAQPVDEYLRAHLAGYSSTQFLNRAAGELYTVWEIGWRDHYYTRGRAISLPHATRQLGRPLEEVLTSKAVQDDLPGIVARLKSAGVTHLVLNLQQQVMRNTPEERRTGVMAAEFGRRHLQLLFADREYCVYKLVDRREAAREGPDLVSNGGFESLGRDGALLGWSTDQSPTVTRVDDNNKVLLTPRAQVAQTVPVVANRLYELRVEVRAPAPRSTQVQARWLDETGTPRLFWRTVVSGEGHFRFNQTAPEAVSTVVVALLGGEGMVDDVALREVLP